MKPKSISRLQGLRRSSTLALVTAITAFAAGFASSTQFTWQGNSDTTWTNASNWNANGIAQTNGTFIHRLSVNNTGANSINPATYNFPGITTTYAADSANGSRSLVIGSGSSGSMIISGGTFSTLGGVSADIIGNVTGNAGTLTIDGTANGGDAHYIGTSVNTSMGLGFGSTGTLNIKNGSATLFDLITNNTTATITLETGGTLTMNKLTYSGGGNNNINFDGGTLKARTASTTFIATPSNGNTTINIKAGGAIIDTNGFDITITRPLLQDGLSTGGGITKNGTGNLTLTAVSTTTGPAVVSAGGLALSAGTNSWQPSSFTHSGNLLNFNLGVYNPSNPAVIASAGILTLNSSITVNVSGSQFTVGQIPLISYGSKAGAGSLTLNTASLPAGVIATLEDDGAGLIYLDVTQGGFVWSGDVATPAPEIGTPPAQTGTISLPPTPPPLPSPSPISAAAARSRWTPASPRHPSSLPTRSTMTTYSQALAKSLVTRSSTRPAPAG
jgi:fibronectin-binding autotransporter adhesin